MRYYIADLHFCHENLNTRMDCRGFESGETMNEYMIAQWNSRVRKRDEVVIIDFPIMCDPFKMRWIKLFVRNKMIMISDDQILLSFYPAMSIR